MRKIIASIMFIALLPLAACGSNESNEYGGVCVDPRTEVRLDDDYCDRTDSQYLSSAVLWYVLLNSNTSYPAVGQRVNKSNFRTTKPKSGQVFTGLSKSGGKASDFKSSDTYKRESKND